jgi:EpsI family protein
MTATRLIVAQVILVAGLGSVFLLPKVASSTPQGIELSLPTYVGEWFGEDQQISEMELRVLARDTAFARKLYSNGRGDQVFVSIVLSGQDLDNSIHRPERCLPAQGWSVADSRKVRLPVAGSTGRELEATRLHNVRKVVAANGQTIPVYSLNYYWFVGWKDTTASHLERTYFDIRDRLLYGYNQRWAYITVAATVTKRLTNFGRSEAETDALLQDFIRRLLPEIHRPGGAEAPSVATR